MVDECQSMRMVVMVRVYQRNMNPAGMENDKSVSDVSHQFGKPAGRYCDGES